MRTNIVIDDQLPEAAMGRAGDLALAAGVAAPTKAGSRCRVIAEQARASWQRRLSGASFVIARALSHPRQSGFGPRHPPPRLHKIERPYFSISLTSRTRYDR
jgi:hypothetical protein